MPLLAQPCAVGRLSLTAPLGLRRDLSEEELQELWCFPKNSGLLSLFHSYSEIGSKGQKQEVE